MRPWRVGGLVALLQAVVLLARGAEEELQEGGAPENDGLCLLIKNPMKSRKEHRLVVHQGDPEEGGWVQSIQLAKQTISHRNKPVISYFTVVSEEKSLMAFFFFIDKIIHDQFSTCCVQSLCET